MHTYYTNERHTQILIALMKAHGIKKVVASPGTTNLCFVGSIQSDPYFEIYSSVDERSAAFIACGLSAESGEPVALSCTGSTASRNYVPGLTEAFYRHLPILAITASQHLGRTGNLNPQFIDRTQQMKDMVNTSIQIQPVYCEEDIWACELNINRALLALKDNGGGPAHINLITTYSKDYSIRSLPTVKVINTFNLSTKFPEIEKNRRIAILVGVHNKWKKELTEEVDKFCEKYDAVVLDSHATNYKGNYGVNFAVIRNTLGYENPLLNADLVIYFGNCARYSTGFKNAEFWRVSPDGKIVDSEKKLTKVFQMEEIDFFRYYNSVENKNIEIFSKEKGYAAQWKKLYNDIIAKVPELPFSNVWVAQQLIRKLPSECVLHISGSNTARSWNFFELPKSVECYSNDGTMGIDGQVSALIGESLASPNRLHFGAVGDLTFFYDMNSLGNRHVKNNIRLLVINNGKGAEFKLYSHPAYAFGEDGDLYMAAAGHFGNKSHCLIKHYVEDLGYEYLCANNKTEFEEKVSRFVTPELTEQSMVFEIFTDTTDESDAIYIMNHLVQTINGSVKEVAKGAIKSIAGEKGLATVKKILGKQ